MAPFNYLLIFATLMVRLNLALGGDNTKAFLPASNSTTFPRLRLVGSLPVLHEFTFCSWIRIYDTKNRSLFIFSYATSVSDNEVAFLLHTDKNRLMARLHVGSLFVDFSCPMLKYRKGLWKHICVTWFAANGDTEVFVNSEKCEPSKDPQVSPGGVVRRDGIAIIGQDQDAMDSKFDPTQGWYGDIADVQLWDVLTRTQIGEAGKCGGKRKSGNVIAWLRTPMVAIDGAILAETQLCQP